MNEREIVLSPEQYAELERELRKFKRPAFAEKMLEQYADEPRPQMVVSGIDWVSPDKLVDMYPATNRKQRRAMKAHARRAAWASRKR